MILKLMSLDAGFFIRQSQVLIDKNYQLCYIYPKFNEGVASGIFRNKSTIAASVNDRYLAYFKL